MRKHWHELPAFSPPFAPANDPLGITGIKGWRLREPVSGRRYTVVRVEARGGLTGYGEGGPVSGSDIAEARAALSGRRATESEFIRQRLAAIPAVEAAVNMAMLDLMGKSTQAPVYRYLGGPTRFKARVLAHLEGDNDAALTESLMRAQKQGFKAFTFPIPARDALWRMQAYTDAVRKRLEVLKAAAHADDVDFVLDAHASLEPGDAAFLATALERAHMLWFDEPVGVLTSDALSKISDESVMPVGLGRSIHDLSLFQNLLRWGVVDILRPDIGTNGIQKIRRMAAVAETHYVAVGPHHDGGPLGTVAAIHLAASLPNFFIQQVPQPAAAEDRAMRAALTSGDQETATDGFAKLLNKPGLGCDVSEPALDKYSEERV